MDTRTDSEPKLLGAFGSSAPMSRLPPPSARDRLAGAAASVSSSRLPQIDAHQAHHNFTSSSKREAQAAAAERVAARIASARLASARLPSSGRAPLREQNRRPSQAGGGGSSHRAGSGSGRKLASGGSYKLPPQVQGAGEAGSLHGRRFNIEAAHGSVPAVEYVPAAGAKVVGALLLTPGSGGGLGPGLAVHPQPFDDIKKAAAQGAIYTRLGMELSSTREVNWQYRPTGPALGPLVGGKAQTPLYALAVVQIDWTRIPRTTLRRMDMLQSSTADVAAAAKWLIQQYPAVPLFLGGFSFGGPTNWAVARQLQQQSPGVLGGVISIAGSARGGAKYEAEEFDTAGAVRVVADGKVPVLFVHGTHDKNVALQVAEHLYKQASKPKEMVVLFNAPHMLDNCREATFMAIRRWVLSAALGDLLTNHPDVVKPTEGKISRIGKEPKLRPGESKGKERWRCDVSQNRLDKYCHELEDGSMHPLAGLVGYSE